MTTIVPNLVISLNSEKVIEYHRGKPLSKKQQLDLVALDKKLNIGIQIGQQFISKPTLQDKATFIANLLVSALVEDDEAKVALTCAYLANHCGDLKQIKAEHRLDRLSIQLIYDEEYRDQAPIKFVPRNKIE